MDDDDANIPDAKTCQKLVEDFVEITGSDEACAQYFLQDHQWLLEGSVNAFFEAKGKTGANEIAEDNSSINDSDVLITFEKVSASVVNALSKATGCQATTEAPPRFRFATWNIDGLDKKNLKKRTKGAAKVIEIEKLDIIFLQEVVPETCKYLENLLPQYQFIKSSNGDSIDDYFNVTLLSCFTVKLDSFEKIPFQNSIMGRSLLCVEAHIGALKLTLINTHLESTADFSIQRKEQLQMALQRMEETTLERTVVFAGDFNLRDKEVAEIGLPINISDVWELCGRRKECEYTWDAMRNSNIEIGGKYRPRLRFDRVYLRHSKPSAIRTVYFGLIGIQKITGMQCFCSDHWGIVVNFERFDTTMNSTPETSAPKTVGILEPSNSIATSSGATARPGHPWDSIGAGVKLGHHDPFNHVPSYEVSTLGQSYLGESPSQLHSPRKRCSGKRKGKRGKVDSVKSTVLDVSEGMEDEVIELDGDSD